MTLKEMREKAGLRPAEVARRLNVSVAAVSNWENGWNGIVSKYIKPLAKLYGVSELEILTIAEANRKGNKEDA